MRCARGAEYNLYTGGGGGTGISGAYTGSDYISGEGGASAWTTERRDYTPVNTSGIRGNGGGGWNDNLTSGIKHHPVQTAWADMFLYTLADGKYY